MIRGCVDGHVKGLKFFLPQHEIEAVRKERNVATDGIDIRKWVLEKDDEAIAATNNSNRVVFRGNSFIS